MNKAILLGRISKEPETKEINGQKVTKFTLTTSEKTKDKSGETKELTEWHNVVVWGKLAEVAEKYLSKGSQLLVEGKINYKSWEDKDGNKKYMTEINCISFQMLGGKQDPKPSNDNSKGNEPNDENLDLPF